MRLYNQLTHRMEKFQPQNPKEVKIYTCGPTVYSFQHIGNYAAYIYWDLLLRTLIADGYTPKRVLNITDVGHLVSDADDGEDKLEKGAQRDHKSVWEIADYYTNEFMNDFHQLNLLEPAKIARATDYIKDEQRLVDILTEKGYSYETSDGIYFDTSKFPTYADFAKLNLDNLKAGARVAFSSEKRNASDFALWKIIKPGEKHDMQWSYLGKMGYPGWHLECSTIIHRELGETIDIHTGGIDHIPTHHSNEIAQSEAAFGKKLSYFWIHCNFITIDGQKISKSLGNVYTLQDIADRNFSPMDFKTWIYQGHYQSERNFTFSDLSAAQQRRLNWRNRIALTFQREIPDNTTAINQIIDNLNDNLNSAAAFATIDAANELSLHDWQKIDNFFGLNLVQDSPRINSEQEHLIKLREDARISKDYTKADEYRNILAQQGITVADVKDGQTWGYLF